MTAKPTITQQIVALQALTVPALVQKYTEVYGRAPHVKANRIWLWRRVAYRIQEIAYGGLPEDAQRRLEQLMAEVVISAAPNTVTGSLPRRRAKGDLSPGTTLTRAYRGQQITVRVTDSGFEYGGVPYRSLSAVAQAITGQHWSGALFFGLRKRSKPA